MTNSDSDSGTAFPALENHAIYAGDCNGKCSVKDFLAHMPESGSTACREFDQWVTLNRFRVYWYPTGNQELDMSFQSTSFEPACVSDVKEQSILWKLMAFLLERSDSGLFIQFWTPTTSSSGRSVLTVLGQPFGMSSLCNGFCRYRYVCMKQSIQGEDNTFGPVERVFTRGSAEYSERMEFYSTEEFPMMDYAKFRGSYLALPIFESGALRKCIGVLEFLSTGCIVRRYSVVLMQLKNVGLTCARSHSTHCPQVKHKLLIPLYRDVLHFVREEHKLPLIQIWIPCFCDKTSSIARLFCCWSSRSSVEDWIKPANGCYFVENGEGLVGRAYSQKKSCFLGDTSQLSISEYPLVHFTRSCGLTACFAIPVQSKLHDFILEVYLPLQQNWDHGNAGVMLQLLLSTMAKNRIPRYHTGPVPFELEQNKEFCAQYSHSDGENFVYFDVSQNRLTVSAGEALGNGREEHHSQPTQKEDNDQNSGVHVAPLNRVERFRESFTNSDAEEVECVGQSTLNHAVYKRKEFHNTESTTRQQNTQSVEAGGQIIQEPEIGTRPDKKARENEATGKSTAPGNDEINRGNRIIVEAQYRGDLAKFFFWSNSGIEGLHRKLHKRFKLEAEKFKINYKDDDGQWIVLSCDEDLLFHLETSKTSGQIILELSVLSATY